MRGFPLGKRGLGTAPSSLGFSASEEDGRVAAYCGLELAAAAGAQPCTPSALAPHPLPGGMPQGSSYSC